MVTFNVHHMSTTARSMSTTTDAPRLELGDQRIEGGSARSRTTGWCAGGYFSAL